MRSRGRDRLADHTIEVGPTAELNLRVSVATLTRVLFSSPDDGGEMLALEHKATLVTGNGEPKVEMRVQPFGGAVRIANPDHFLNVVGEFNYDSQRSREEQDFRVYISPGSWDAVREFCRDNLLEADHSLLDSDPTRELVEEYQDTLGIDLQPHQYSISPVGMVVENEPAPSGNIRAESSPTVRIYRVDQAQIMDPDLCQVMVRNSMEHPAMVLRRKAENDYENGGKGRANAIFTAPLEEITSLYRKLEPEKRGDILLFGGTVLAGNIAAILDNVPTPKYQQFA
jgi:hypothetical protein